jgi:hypothetical protein
MYRVAMRLTFWQRGRERLRAMRGSDVWKSRPHTVASQTCERLADFRGVARIEDHGRIK